MMREKFPKDWCSAEHTIHGKDAPDEYFRLTTVDDNHTAKAGQGATVDAAFAILISEYEKPRTEEINRARALLESEGFQVQAATL